MNFESPIEEKLARALVNLTHAGVAWESQRPIHADGHSFRADFFLTIGSRHVVIECDGKDWHEYWEDHWRDMLMLDRGGVDEIYRFRGCDIVFDPEACVRFVRWFGAYLFDARRDPTAFSDKLLQCRLLSPCPDKSIHRCRVPLEEFVGNFDCPTFCSRGRTRDGLAAIAEFKTQYWDRKYADPDGPGPMAWSMEDVFSLTDFSQPIRSRK